MAWLATDCIGERYLCFSPPLDNDQVLPLYTVPPQRKPLTDDEIADLWGAPLTNTTDLKLVKDFVRDIEAAHGIKE